MRIKCETFKIDLLPISCSAKGLDPVAPLDPCPLHYFNRKPTGSVDRKLAVMADSLPAPSIVQGLQFVMQHCGWVLRHNVMKSVHGKNTYHIKH